ncbi:hypothetical protein BJF85_06060 [Saccharomonospora sp. CUA-673]|nr:hypothetical protein BJF85_06060 [Saccharomonospora sp. CUA-673]
MGAQAMPIAQVFGDAASLVGVASGAGANVTDVESGGDIDASGQDGAVSGTIVDVPVGAVAQVFGVAPSVAGVANAVADNTTEGEVGGETSTEGNNNALSGVDAQLPVGALAQVYDLPLALLAEATSVTANDTDVEVAENEPQINLPIDGSELPATEVPNTPYVQAAFDRVAELAGSSPMQRSAMPTDAGVPSLPGVPAAPSLPSAPSLPEAPEVPVDAFSGQLPVDGLLPQVEGAGLPAGLPTEVPTELPAGELPAGELPADPTAGASTASSTACR